MFLVPRKDKLRDNELANAYEYMSNHRILFLYSVMINFPLRQDTFSSSSVADTLIAMNMQSHDPIWLIIQSPGGSTDEGLMLVDTMRSIESPVYTLGRSTASMATVVLAAGEPGHRYLLPNGKAMLHLVSGEMGGDVKDMKIATAYADRVQETLVDLLLECGVNKTRKELDDDIERDFWLFGQEAIDYGLVDKFFSQGMFPTDMGGDKGPNEELTRHPNGQESSTDE